MQKGRPCVEGRQPCNPVVLILEPHPELVLILEPHVLAQVGGSAASFVAASHQSCSALFGSPLHGTSPFVFTLPSLCLMEMKCLSLTAEGCEWHCCAKSSQHTAASDLICSLLWLGFFFLFHFFSFVWFGFFFNSVLQGK